ncbi:Uncharacterised protein [uncultured archaeon]|nr:Uncharacterised protein [uncultured archaeon]
MFFVRSALIVLGLTLMVLSWNACAQWSPGGTMVYMGDLNLARSSVSSGSAPYTVGGPSTSQASQNNSTQNETVNNATMNNTASNNAVPVNSLDIKSPGLQPLDLSHYASDRTSKNLKGYKNIMYPISESRGSTATTASGGGCGGCSG